MTISSKQVYFRLSTLSVDNLDLVFEKAIIHACQLRLRHVHNIVILVYRIHVTKVKGFCYVENEIATV